MASRTTPAEVLQISPDGLRVKAGGREYRLSFERFPAFASAPVGDVLSVEMPDSDHLRWPGLDVTIALGSLEAVDPLAFLRS